MTGQLPIDIIYVMSFYKLDNAIHFRDSPDSGNTSDGVEMPESCIQVHVSGNALHMSARMTMLAPSGY